jgi:hypothetical protein
MIFRFVLWHALQILLWIYIVFEFLFCNLVGENGREDPQLLHFPKIATADQLFLFYPISIVDKNSNRNIWCLVEIAALYGWGLAVPHGLQIWKFQTGQRGS